MEILEDGSHVGKGGGGWNEREKVGWGGMEKEDEGERENKGCVKRGGVRWEGKREGWFNWI